MDSDKPKRILSQDDVGRLLTDPSEDTRASTAEKIAAQLEAPELTEQEREIARDIVRAMARDVAVKVRATLSQSLKESSQLPRDVARLLAGDVESVSLPILEFSKALSDSDLIEIIQAGNPTRQEAIARRSEVSTDVSDSLIDHGTATVVATLMSNEGAEIREEGMSRAIDKFGTLPEVNAAMAQRRTLPAPIAERLVNLVSDHIRDHLVTTHQLSPDLALDLIMQARERTLLNFVSDDDDARDTRSLVHQLHKNQRLTDSLLLRALCMGDLAFFEHGMAARAGLPVTNASILINDAGNLGLNSICERAHVPDALIPAMRTALIVAQETERNERVDDLYTKRRMVIERILTQYEGMADADVDFLIAKLGDLIEQQPANA